ncbi:hypothetical protein EJ02DRAFT_514951 [Clathrospora elynae]|uniref:N-acetyltransferase domain-containing protein n=1 Tax=Clathrospora elynae TaxID=706981 RepID=A0A6A5SD39_9PLEO|nr:hypothetical protein EJ02DRAFT_514951 [Clathrospora elynae]
MDPIVFTPRMKLTLMTKAERESPELRWLHELRSEEKVTWWSIHGCSKTLEETEKFAKGCLPAGPEEDEPKSYRVAYAVHERLNRTEKSVEDGTKPEALPTRFIGMVTLRSLGQNDIILPSHLFPTTIASPDVLTTEVAYYFLPHVWGKGYAVEAVDAVFSACRNGSSFWAPYKRVYVRAMVNEGNIASQKVMAKTDMVRRCVHAWEGKAVWLAGKWINKSKEHIFGMWLLE